MFVSFLSHILCAYFAFALPCYATYKTLAHAPSPDALRPLAMHWAVVGAFVAFEHSLGLGLSWLPFYWELRTLFLLYVSLPQTQGYAYVYKTCLEPWCSRNESALDAAVASAQSNTIAFCRARIAAILDLVHSFLNKTSATAQPLSSGSTPHPADQLKDLWATYGLPILAAFTPKDTSDVHVSGGSRDEMHKPYSGN